MTETFNILSDLIKIPSYVDESHDERNLIKYIKTFFEEKTGYKVVSQSVEGERENILVYKKKNPKVCLFGHVDTVLPKQESEDSFTARDDGEKIFGLGAVDMKAGLAVMLHLATISENEDLAFVFSVDEEFDFKGAKKLREIRDFHPEVIVNVEPTDNKIINGCRGICEFSFRLIGKSAHAGRKEFGVNAIEKAVDLVKVLQESVTKLDVAEGGKSSVNLAYLHGGMLKKAENGGAHISGLGNVVPDYAELNCEIRIANLVITKDYIEQKLMEIASSLSVRVKDVKFKFMLGSMYTDKKDLTLFENTLKENGVEVVYGDISLAGYYEVQMLQEVWGGKAIVFGPGPIDMSHKMNEYVEKKSIENTERCLLSFIKEVCG